MRTVPALRVLGAVGAAAACLAVAATAAAPTFYDDDPVWREVVSQDAAAMKRYEPGLIYDLAENVFAKPGDPDFTRRALNVNTVDEVPDGEWFVNRGRLRPLDAAEIGRGANTGDGPPPGNWTVIAAKSDGVTPGFTIRGAAGNVWFVKFDPPGYRAMATGAEVVAAKLFWALGYHTTEYYIQALRRDMLVIDESATFTPPNGAERRMRQSDIDTLLQQAARDPDGSYRVIVSLATPGTPVGRIRFHGTRPDDPNNLVPHEHRRELRGYGVFAAWLNHVDAKSTNSIDVLISEGGRSFVRHYLLDFGSTLGSAAIGPRDHWEGFEPLIETPGTVGKRLFAFGFPVPKWRTLEFYESPSIGRIPLDNTTWDPEGWQPRVTNAAFLRARADDKFWAARKVTAIGDDGIRAAVAEARLGDEASEQALMRVLRERRDAIGRRYLAAVNPVVDLALAAGTLTFRNAAVDAGVAPPAEKYIAAWSAFDNATGTATPLAETEGAEPRLAAPGALTSAYVKVELRAVSATHQAWARPVHAYFRRAGSGWTLVGFERMPGSAAAAVATTTRR